MFERLKKIFEANPEKSTISFKGQCSDCGRSVIIFVSPTSQGFGLKGGCISEHGAGIYLAKCTDCYKISSTFSAHHKHQYKCTMVT
jgi:ribosomal protein S27E